MKPQIIALTTSILIGAGCQTIPLDQKYTTRQLIEQYRHDRPCEAEETTAGLLHDFAKCAKDEQARRAEIRRALAVRVDRDLAAAPKCLKDRQLDAEVLRDFGINPSTPNALAELMSLGVVYVGGLSAECITQVCDWQARFEPDRDRLWCQT